MKSLRAKLIRWLLTLLGADEAVEKNDLFRMAATPDLAPDCPEYVPLVPGKVLEVAGRKLVFAPLNAAAVGQFQEEILKVGIGSIPDVRLVSKLAHASLIRNYPSVTIKAVEDMIDYGNVMEVWQAVINLAGLVAQAGEMARSVEAQMRAAGLAS